MRPRAECLEVVVVVVVMGGKGKTHTISLTQPERSPASNEGGDLQGKGTRQGTHKQQNKK